MKAAVKDDEWYYTTHYSYGNYSDDSAEINVEGLERELLAVILRQMNMTFVHVHTQHTFDINNFPVDSIFKALILKDSYSVIGSMGTIFFDSAIFRRHQYLFPLECQLVCTVSCQISKMEQHI
jgi:hypothetical protein